jgi:hypothetical protein
MIDNTGTSDQCLLFIATATRNPQVCAGLSGGNASLCAYRIALLTNDTAACSLVGSEAGAEECNATVNFNAAIRQDSASACSRMPFDNDTNETYGILQNTTFGAYAGVEANLTMMLQYWAVAGRAVGIRDLCYVGIAFKSRNISYCSYVQEANLSSDCSSALSVAPNKAVGSSFLNSTTIQGLCSVSANSSDQVNCTYFYMSIEALQTGNRTICDSIPAPFSYNCYYYLAVKFNQTAYCNYITNFTYNNACVGYFSGIYPRNISGD